MKKIKQSLSVILESIMVSLFFVFLAVLIAGEIFAASFNCSIVSADSCTGTGNISVFRLMNASNGFWNAHAQNATVTSYNPVYNYSVCCFSDGTLSIAQPCSEATVIKLSNWTNAHVQQGSYAGGSTAYSLSVCLSVEPGTLSCSYSSSCSAAQACLASMASSNVSAANQTDAHLGSCTEYSNKICCGVNSPPSVSSVVLNSTYGTNYTDENLSVYFSETDADGDAVTNITDWRKQGVSVAVLNMPFNTNVSSNASGAIKDYSTFSNNGTLGGGTSANMPAWTSSGKVGGAYSFDGVNDYINVSYSPSLNLTGQNRTFGGWFKPWSTGTYQMLFGRPGTGTDANNQFAIWILTGTNITYAEVGNGTSYCTSQGAVNSASFGNWMHIMAVYNTSSIVLYLNGVAQNTGACTGNGQGDASTASVYVGVGNNGAAYFFNGTIDEVQIFNYSLSANQIKAMYRAGIENHSVQLMHSDETTKYENWSVAVTPNDGYNDGTTVVSNTLNIRNSLPVVNLTFPNNGNSTRLRNPIFSWNATDADGDAMSYQINITAVAMPSPLSICNDSVLNTSSVMNFTPAADLACFYDNNYQYNWSVRANDSDGYGSWSQTWTFNMTAVVDMSMPVSSVSFGSIPLWGSNDTLTNSPPPFKLQNDGNALINVNVTSTNLWNILANPSSYYKFKINVSEELNSFNFAGSATNWTQFPASGTNASGISLLKYGNANDSAIIDIYVQVPPSEPPGSKSATVTFMSILGE